MREECESGITSSATRRLRVTPPLICRNDENLLKATLDFAIRSLTTRMVKELNIPALSLLILQIAS